MLARVPSWNRYAKKTPDSSHRCESVTCVPTFPSLQKFGRRALYKRRGATVEPVIGNLKKIIDRFSRRLDNAVSELDVAATAFNLMKIHRAAAAA